jgi:hypothetical protein
MCGQVFCNQCSSYYIEKDGVPGPMRSCRLCFEQLGGSLERDGKTSKRKPKRAESTLASGESTSGSAFAADVDSGRQHSLSVSGPSASAAAATLQVTNDTASRAFETPESRDRHVGNLQVPILDLSLTFA